MSFGGDPACEDGAWGVWTGRYQPFHVGHLSLVDEVHKRLGLRQWIVLPVDRPSSHLLSSLDPHSSAQVRRAYSPVKNPFTPAERLELVRLGLLASAANPSVAATLAPHYLEEGVLRRFYPYPRTILLTDKDLFEGLKSRIWASLGERVMVVDLPVRDRFVRGSDVRAAIARGEDWRAFLPEPAWEYFAEIDGPGRLHALGKSHGRTPGPLTHG